MSLRFKDTEYSLLRNDEILESPEFRSWRRLHLCKSKLSNVGEMTTLMAFFSVMAAVEMQIADGDATPELIIAFVSVTSLMVSTTIIVMVITTSILPSIEAVAETSDFTDAIRSPHDQLINIIDITCVLGHTIIPLLFCVDIILISWIKFRHFSIEAPIAVTAIMAPILIIIIIFGVVLFKQITEYRKVECLIPNRRYSEIAETWEEDESTNSSRRSSYSETSELLTSYNSITYGATFQNEHVFYYNVSQKTYSDMFK